MVRNLILQRRQVECNWKERICGLSDHQPDSCGVLCSVDYYNDTILMWCVYVCVCDIYADAICKSLVAFATRLSIMTLVLLAQPEFV